MIADEALGRLGQLDRNRVAEIIGAIEDTTLRKKMTELIGKAINARQLLARIDLKPFEAAHHDIEGIEIWKQLASQFSTCLKEISATLEMLSAFTPDVEEVTISESDLEMAFEEFDAPLTDGDYEPPRDKLGQQLDTLIQSTVDGASQQLSTSELIMTRVGDTAYAISSVLKEEMVRFGGRMRLTAVVNDRWNLLAELQETRHKLTKGIDGLIIGICSSFSTVTRDEVIPGFHTELSSSIELRTLLSDLREKIRGYRTAIDQAKEDQWYAIGHDIFSQLEQFVFGPVFGWLRAFDKRELIQFRTNLREALGAEHPNPRQVKEIAEGTLRFLEALEVINQREILVEHDKKLLLQARQSLRVVQENGLESSRQDLAQALAALAEVNGRDKVLDEMVEDALDPTGKLLIDDIVNRVELLVSSL